MTVIDAAKSVLNTKSALLLRWEGAAADGTASFAVYPWGGGKADGCTLLDLQTANALKTVYEGITEESRARFLRCPSLAALVNMAWKAVKVG